MRRLPVYILIQTSGAMRGEPIKAIKESLKTVVFSLRQNPFALETVHLSVITFNRYPEQILPLTDITSVQIPTIKQPEAAGSHLGEALEFVYKKIDSDVIPTTSERKRDWRPVLIIMCDGRVNDISVFQKIIPTIKQMGWSIGVFLIGNKKTDKDVRMLTDNIVITSGDIKLFIPQLLYDVEAPISDGQNENCDLLLTSPPLEINKIV